MLMIETQRRISWHQLAVVTPAVVICCYTPLRGFEPRGRCTGHDAVLLHAVTWVRAARPLHEARCDGFVGKHHLWRTIVSVRIPPQQRVTSVEPRDDIRLIRDSNNLGWVAAGAV